MVRRLTWALALSVVLSGIAAGAFCQDTVKLEYKYTPGELLRYKMVMDMTMSLQMNSPDAAVQQMPSIPIRMVGVLRQRTKKVLPDGNAEIVAAVESMKMTMGDKTEKVPINKMPVMTMIVSKNGTLKSMQGLEKLGELPGGMQFMNPGTFGQYNGLPDTEMKVGDTWTQEVPFPTGTGNMLVSTKLLSANTKLGNHAVAVLEQVFGGDIGFGMPLPVQSDGASGNAGMDTKGTLSGKSKVYFSADKGRLIRADGDADIQMTVNSTGGPDGQSAAMVMDMRMNFDIFLLPSPG